MRLPHSKHDLEAIEALYNTDIASVDEQLPELLTWLQDINWPVAAPLVEYLRINFAALPSMEVTLLEILKGDDGIWKYWLIVSLGDLFQTPALLQMLSDLAYHPSADDKYEEVNIAALEALEKRS